MFSDEDRARGWMEDIVENAGRIAEYIGHVDFEAFAADAKTRDAVERCIERITEAAVRLGPERLARIAPNAPLHEVKGLGNVLRHEYQRVNARLIWETATVDVPALGEACSRALDRKVAESGLRQRLGMRILFGKHGQVLKHGHELAGVLASVERRLVKVVAG